jgi:hypothetical protein
VWVALGLITRIRGKVRAPLFSKPLVDTEKRLKYFLCTGILFPLCLNLEPLVQGEEFYGFCFTCPSLACVFRA